jgi:hypothetical protein
MVRASVLFLTSTFIVAMYFIVPSDWLGDAPLGLPSPEGIGFDFMDAVAVTLAAFTNLGTLAFGFGVALLGWIRSRPVGFFSTIRAHLLALVFNVIVTDADLLVLSAGSQSWGPTESIGLTQAQRTLWYNQTVSKCRSRQVCCRNSANQVLCTLAG